MTDSEQRTRTSRSQTARKVTIASRFAADTRVMADEALERADKARPNRSSGYLEIAERWLELADDMEKYANRDGEPLRTSVEAQS